MERFTFDKSMRSYSSCDLFFIPLKIKIEFIYAAQRALHYKRSVASWNKTRKHSDFHMVQTQVAGNKAGWSNQQAIKGSIYARFNRLRVYHPWKVNSAQISNCGGHWYSFEPSDTSSNPIAVHSKIGSKWRKASPELTKILWKSELIPLPGRGFFTVSSEEANFFC